MTPEQQVIALAAFIGTSGGAIIKWLVTELNRRDTAWGERLAKCEGRQDVSTLAMDKLADALRTQLDSPPLGRS